MPIDLSEFHRTFFDESLETIDVMERGLLRLEHAATRGEAPAEAREEIHQIFRCAHSIKGASSTFGFGDVADFAHLLESLLEELRGGRRAAEPALVGLLLRAADSLRALVKAAQAGGSASSPDLSDVRAALEALVAGKSQPLSPVQPGAPEAPPASWRIHFKPHPSLFATGNDPLRILREVAALGPLTVRADTTSLPSWETFDPQHCYLGWEMELSAPVPRPTLEEVFAWVYEISDLSLEPLASAPSPVPPAIEAVASSIRVGTAKVDALVDMVGELVITQTMLQSLLSEIPAEQHRRAHATLAQLERHTRALQDIVLGIRMLPIGFVYGRLRRLVRDVAQQLGKKVDLRLSGDATELDKAIIERIADPLMHILRNAVDHGIESTAERIRAKKAETGTIHIEAYHSSGGVVIEIEDDGRGLDRDRILANSRARGLVAEKEEVGPREIEGLIFLPGLSTASTVNGVSGRGVGLDVVRNNIRSLGGGIEVMSEPGRGTRFRIRLPLTLAIVDGLSLRVGREIYILPLGWIRESLRLRSGDVVRPAGGAELYARRGEYLPLLRLPELFGQTADGSEPIVVVIEADGQKAGLLVDELLGQQQVVIKSLDTHCYKFEGISAATVLGDGRVALILDAAALIRLAYRSMIAIPMPGETVRPPAQQPLH